MFSLYNHCRVIVLWIFQACNFFFFELILLSGQRKQGRKLSLIEKVENKLAKIKISA